MGISTRSKTGAALPPSPAISKQQRTSEGSRQPKGKKGAKAAQPRAKAGVGGAVGAAFPEDISLLTDAGGHVKTGDLLTDSLPGMVLFTYPRANTPGCTTQACALRDALPDLSAKGYSVVGLSYDKPKGQAGWKAKHTLGYTLLCDTLDAGLIKMLGAHKAPKGIKRSVFVVRKQDGKAVVVMSQIGISPKDTVPTVKEYVDKNPCLPEEGEEEKELKESEPEKKDNANGK